MLKQIVLTGCAVLCLSLAAPQQSEACLFPWLFGCHSCFRPTTAAYCPSPCSTTACSPCSTGSCSPCGVSGVSGGCATGDCNINTYSIPQSDDLNTTQTLRYGVPAGMVVQPFGPAPVIVHPAPQPQVEETPDLTLPETSEPVAVRQRIAPKPVVQAASIRRTANDSSVTDSTAINAGWIPVGP